MSRKEQTEKLLKAIEEFANAKAMTLVPAPDEIMQAHFEQLKQAKINLDQILDGIYK